MSNKVLISVMVNNESKFTKKISKEITLPEVRKLLAKNYLLILNLPYQMEVELIKIMKMIIRCLK